MSLTLVTKPVVNPGVLFLLKEDGTAILLEDNTEILLEEDGIEVIGAKGQVFYEFSRKDFDVAWSDNGVGILKATITGDQTSLITNGDTIFVGAVTNYNEVGTVATAPAFASGSTTFDTSLTFIAVDTGGYINNLSTHTNYRVEIQVWNFGVTEQLIDESFEYVPKQSGILFTDLQDLMLFILRSNDLLSKHTAIKWREVWNEDTTDTFNTAYPIQVLNGVKPQAINGTFLSVHQIYLEFIARTSPLGRWLTMFPSKDAKTGQASKLLFKGWANFMYYIVDTNFNSRTGGDPETEEYSEAITGGTALLTGPTAVATTVTVVEHEITNNNNSAWAIQLQIKEDTGSAEVFESYTLQNAEQRDNQIMIQWLNSLGGRDQWLFQYNQTVRESYTSDITSFSKHSELFENQSTRSITRVNAEVVQKLQVEASAMTEEQFLAMKDIFLSDDVDVWLKKDASKKKGCIVDARKVAYDTKDNLYDLMITIEFEPGYDLFRNLEY